MLHGVIRRVADGVLLPFGVSGLRPMEHDAFAGQPLSESATGRANPPVGATRTELAAEALRATESVAGAAVSDHVDGV